MDMEIKASSYYRLVAKTIFLFLVEREKELTWGTLEARPLIQI